MSKPYDVSAGEPHPLGATVMDGGVNFSLFSRHATGVELLLFDRYNSSQPTQIISLDPHIHRTFSYWHAFVHGASDGLVYAYRVDGPWAPEEGHRFNRNKVLLDPYARGIVYDETYSHADACHGGPNVETSMKSLVVDNSNFDWEGVEPPRIDPSERVIYEVHVRGFTRHPSADVSVPGTFDGIVEKIPYLLDLGVTTIELLPVFQFDEAESAFFNPRTGEPLTNYWGYSPLGFFAPHRGYYTHDWTTMRYLTGFRDMVKALHRAGLEVFLDVVFNHTAEGGAGGPTLSFRGIDNSVYYIAEPHDRAGYANYSGTGNTVSCNHPVVRKLVLDCLRYWVDVMHVDGFRFDLASVLSRDEAGHPMVNPPLPWEIEMDPVLSRTPLIAEAWDAAGLYQVGHFPGERWFEWNGVYRDQVRRFVAGEFGLAGQVASRMMGSRDVYEQRGQLAYQSINFVTCHDGFTLHDLVSYNHKHNEDNGEESRDGSDANYSYNYGAEGETNDPDVNRIRRQQMKNFIAILMLSQGTPMLLGGDEMGRTQRGNNNAYAQDNETSWFDWDRARKFEDIYRFTRAMIRLRKAHPSLRRERFLQAYDAPYDQDRTGYTRVRWHGTELDRPDWSPASRVVAYTLTESTDDVPLHVMINMHLEPLTFRLPPPPDYDWYRTVDTARPPPDDVHDSPWVAVRGPTIEVQPRSVMVLVSPRKSG